MVRVEHKQFCRFRLFVPQVVHVVETGTHTELDTACLLKETTPVQLHVHVGGMGGRERERERER